MIRQPTRQQTITELAGAAKSLLSKWTLDFGDKTSSSNLQQNNVLARRDAPIVGNQYTRKSLSLTNRIWKDM
jgi:hypothetical protein